MRRRTDIVVGGVIVLAALLIFGGTLWVKGSELGREEMTIEAQFREVGQLVRGNAVRLRGVPIGRVEDIYLPLDTDGVVVRMRIRSDVRLPPDPVVILSPRSMFGDWQAEIHPRSRFPRYHYAGGNSPERLPGYSLPDISQLTAVADQIADNLAVITDRVEIAFTEETALNVRRAIENIQDVSEQLTGLVGQQQQTMDGIATSLAATTTTMGDAAATVQRAFDRVDRALAQGEMEQIVESVQRASVQIDSLTAVLMHAGTQFQDVVVRADNVFRSMDAMTAGIGEGRGTLGLLLQDTLLYQELLESNAALQALLDDIRENPRKYIRLRIFGG
jgi:phospholipid/cholesterol/gamma-HCH transport system substrate-binding protein